MMAIFTVYFRWLAPLAFALLGLTSCRLSTWKHEPDVPADVTGSQRVSEDFEGLLKIGHLEASGAMVVQSEHTFRGRGALRINSPGGGYTASYLTIPLDSIGLAQQMYGRMMVWLDMKNSLAGDFSLIQAEGPARAETGAPAGTRVVLRGRVDGRYDHLFSNYDTRVSQAPGADATWTTDCWKHPDFSEQKPPPAIYQVPKNAWVCVQWYFNTTNDEMRFWLNGESLPDIAVEGSGDGCLGGDQQGQWSAPSQLSTLKLGIEQYHPSSLPRQLYIDDITLATTPVACPDSQ